MRWPPLLALLLGCAGVFTPADPPQVAIIVAWPGAAPADTEATLLRPLEAAVAGVAGVTGTRGYAGDGIARLTVTGADAAELRDAVGAIRRDLPPDADVPVVVRVHTGRVWLAVDAPDADAIADALVTRPGVVDVIRHRDRVRPEVILDPPRVAAVGRSVADVVVALRACGAADVEALAACPVGAGVTARDVAQLALGRVPGVSGAGAVLEVVTDAPLDDVPGARPLGDPARAWPAAFDAVRAWPVAVVDDGQAWVWGEGAAPGVVVVPPGPCTTVHVTGPDGDVLVDVADRIAAATGGVLPLPAAPEIAVTRGDWGVSAEAIADVVAVGTEGRAIGDVVVRVADPQALSDLTLTTADGAIVPLSAVATLERRVTRPIAHLDRQRDVPVWVAGPAPDLADVPLPPGVVVTPTTGCEPP